MLIGLFSNLDELFEILTLVQTRKVTTFPVVLMGTAYWAPMVSWLRDHVAATGRINAADLELFEVVDSPQEALQVIKAADELRRTSHHNGHVYGEQQ